MEWSAGGGFFFRQIVRDMVCNMRLNLGVRREREGRVDILSFSLDLIIGNTIIRLYLLEVQTTREIQTCWEFN